MAWTDVAPWAVGQATKISFFNKLLENTRWHRDPTGDFVKVPIGTGQGNTPGAPGYHWADSPATGLFQSGPNQLGVSVAGVQKINIASTLVDIQVALKAINLQLINPLPIASGGTGANSVGTALTALGISTGTATPAAPSTMNIANKDLSAGCSYVQIGKHVLVVGSLQCSGTVIGFQATLYFNLPVPGLMLNAGGTVANAYTHEPVGSVVFNNSSTVKMTWNIQNLNIRNFIYNYHYTLA